jgi:hypothetical protein
VDRGKQGIKRSTAVDRRGIPIGGVTDPANRNDSPLLLAPTLEITLARRLGGSTRRGERAFGSRLRLRRRQLRASKRSRANRRDRREGEVGSAPSGRPTKRWVVERRNSWHSAHKKLVWRTERRGRVIDFWVAFSDVIIIVRRLIQEGWTRYRWESRPPRRP